MYYQQRIYIYIFDPSIHTLPIVGSNNFSCILVLHRVDTLKLKAHGSHSAQLLELKGCRYRKAPKFSDAKKLAEIYLKFKETKPQGILS